LGIFARYGYADQKRNDLSSFWSAGLQYQGLLARRDEDVLAVGFARGFFSNEAAMTFPGGSESVLESYYSVQIAPWVTVSPSIQYLANPGGSSTVADAIVVGVRAQIAF
jgi:porin